MILFVVLETVFLYFVQNKGGPLGFQFLDITKNVDLVVFGEKKTGVKIINCQEI